MEQFYVAIGSFLTAVLTAALVEGRRLLLDWLARQRLESALGRGAGIVLQDSAVQQAGATALDMALAAGVGYVQKAIPGTLSKLGVDDARLAEMLKGQVGKITGGVR